MTQLTHRDLAVGRWWALSLAEQLGNIGSEISRAERWKSRNPDLARGALYRALELLDLTLADPRLRHSRPRLREIARARDQARSEMQASLAGKPSTGDIGRDPAAAVQAAESDADATVAVPATEGAVQPSGDPADAPPVAAPAQDARPDTTAESDSMPVGDDDAPGPDTGIPAAATNPVPGSNSDTDGD